MKDPLAPRPMTQEQVTDLVERTRANAERLRVAVAKAGAEAGRGAARRRRQGAACQGELAARAAHDHGLSIRAAAEQFWRTTPAVHQHWSRLFPGCTPKNTRQPASHAASCPCAAPKEG